MNWTVFLDPGLRKRVPQNMIKYLNSFVLQLNKNCNQCLQLLLALQGPY